MTKEEEIALIKNIITHPAGFNLGLHMLLTIRSHSDGFEVAWGKAAKCIDEYDKNYYKDFTDAQEAAEFFVNKRHELELGIDIEYKLMKEQIK